MATVAGIEKLAQDLSENEKAVLAAHLLGSLPPVLHDEDEGIAEALRRDAELDANPATGVSLDGKDARDLCFEPPRSNRIGTNSGLLIPDASALLR